MALTLASADKTAGVQTTVMGIEGLLRWADSVQLDGHISMFKGNKLAVDLLGWIHKAVYGCGISVAVDKNIYPVVAKLWHRIKELMAFDIRLVLVADGADLPIKSGTNSERRARREKSLQEAIAAYDHGSLLSDAGDMVLAERKFSESIDITPELLHSIVGELLLLDPHLEGKQR